MGQGQGTAGLEERYFLQKVKLGQGSFGTVWRAVDRQTGSMVAMKQLDKASLPGRGVTRQDIEREISMMKACSHENITRLLDIFEDAASIYFALEYCDGGDLGDKVKERGMSVTEDEVAEWCRQICASVVALHAKGICHRDIKPDNFMVSGGSKLKLSDFGLAIFAPRGELLQEKCGTPAFMAPEQHRLPNHSPGYSFPVDIWAAGVSMFMLMFGGKHPFVNNRGDLDDDLLLQGELDFRDSSHYNDLFGFGGRSLRFSEEARRLCKSLVEPDPARRITAEEAAALPWLRLQEQVRLRQEQNESLSEVLQVAQAADGHGGAGGTPLSARPEAGGLLRCGLRCRYESGTYGWMAAVVQSFNPADGTYNLDVRQHAAQDRIAPTSDVVAAEAWPPGTLASYHSASVNQWLPAVVISFNESDGTYNLDVRDHADPDRIRSRVTDGLCGLEKVAVPATLEDPWGEDACGESSHSFEAAPAAEEAPAPAGWLCCLGQSPPSKTQDDVQSWIQGHDFFFVCAEKLKSSTGSLPCFQELQKGDWLMKRRVSMQHVVKRSMRSAAAVSHVWLTQAHPDPEGEQADVLRAFLRENPQIKAVWLDWTCLPQGKKTKKEQVLFAESLKMVNMVYLALGVIIVLDTTYIGRFWPQYEAFLSFQQVDRLGLQPLPAQRRRHAIIVTGIAAESEDSKKRLMDELMDRWRQASVTTALTKLAKSDVLVTNKKDKDIQLQKLTQLQQKIQRIMDALDASSGASGAADQPIETDEQQS